MQRSWEAAAAANDTIVPFTGWAKPDLSIVEARRAPPELPLSLFGNAAGELAKLATDKGGPLDYVALSWLAVCASLVGSKRKAVPYEGSSWEEPSILWPGLVGDPSHNKSPSLDPFMKILRKLEEEKADEHEEALSIFKADAQRAKVERGNWERAVEAAAKEGLSTPPLPDVAHDPKEPVRRRYYVQDTTPESMAGVLVGNPEGTLMFRDELAGWFSSFDRYNPGGRTYWLEAYGGRPYTVDRKGSPEPIRILHNTVSVIGGIQPGKLAESLMGGGADDGLAARILFTWPNRPEFVRPCSTADLAGIEAALRRLDGLDWAIDADMKRQPMRVLLAPAAADAFDDCQRFYRDKEQEVEGLLKSFVGKLSGLTLRIALAAEFARWAYAGGREPENISLATLESAADFVSAYVLPMAERVYGDAALPEVERNTATLAKHIQRHKLQTINARDLRRKSKLPGMHDAASVTAALESLAEAGWVRHDGHRRGGTVGRQSADYAVNPAIWEAA